MFTVNLIVEDNILSTANITQQQLDEVINGIELAASLWSRYIDGNNAVIDISLGFEDLSESTLAEAGSTFFTRNNGPIESEVINELNGQSGEFSTDGQFTIDLPSLKNIEKVVINKAVIQGKKSPLLVYQDDVPKKAASE